MRSFLYVTAGILAGLSGFITSQGILAWTPSAEWIERPEFILFPIVSMFLAVVTVGVEIFLNNPTRSKMNRAILPQPLRIAVLIGLGSGSIAALGIVLATYSSQLNLDPTLAKLFGWVLIGMSAGFADGYSWRIRTIEGAQKTKANRRLFFSIGLGAIAGLIAFSTNLMTRSELIGFLVLGGCLGLFLSRAGSGSLRFALRAGAGLEFVRDSTSFSRINSNQLDLNCLARNERGDRLPSGYERKIEEGISIILPQKGKIRIGSGSDLEIIVDRLPEHSVTIMLDNHRTLIEAHIRDSVWIGQKSLRIGQQEPLFHNQVLTLSSDPAKITNSFEPKFVRFVFYDRFLDPQS